MDPKNRSEQTEEGRLLAELAASEERSRQAQEQITRAMAMAEALERGKTTTGPEPVPPPEPVVASAPVTPPAAPVKKKSKEKKEPTPQTPEQEINNFIKEFNLDPLLPPEFTKPQEEGGLTEAQKLKVIRDLKRRIVDIVKSDAQTQYSEDAKAIMTKLLKPSNNIVFKGLVTAIGTIGNAITKENDLKKAEEKVFAEFTNPIENYPQEDQEKIKERRNLIAQELRILTEKTQQREVYIDTSKEGNPCFYYLPRKNHDEAEGEAFANFNMYANRFSFMPYEWSQEKGKVNKKGEIKGTKNREEYEKAKDEYEKARDEVLRIKAEKRATEIFNEDKTVLLISEAKEKAEKEVMLEMLQMDNAVQMEQLLNTHPEFEKALDDFGRSAGGKELTKRTLKSFFTSNSASKANIGIGITGAGVRFGVKVGLGFTTFAASGMFVAAPVIGAVAGYWRGKIRGKKTLEERKKGARHGQEDESKEATNTVKAENLNKRLETIVSAFYTDLGRRSETTDDGVKMLGENERLDQLKRRIEYTQDKIENGLVNFGNTKTALTNQFNLINNLNRALVLSASLEETTRKDIDKRLEKFLSYRADKISEAQNAFIKKQALRGAAMGAGFATAGYALRYVWEHVHYSGGHASAPTGDKIFSPEESTRLAKLAGLQKHHDLIANYEETVENGQKISYETLKNGNVAKILPDGSYKMYTPNGKLFESGIIDTDEAKVLGIKATADMPEPPTATPTTPPVAETPPEHETPPVAEPTAPADASAPETSAPKPEPSAPPHETPDPTTPITPEVPKTLPEVKVTLSEKGYTQTIIELKKELLKKYVTPDKMPPNIKTFYGTPSTKLAQDYGFWDTKAGTSGMGYKGETLSVDTEGNLKLGHLNGNSETIDTTDHKFNAIHEDKMFKPAPNKTALEGLSKEEQFIKTSPYELEEQEMLRGKNIENTLESTAVAEAKTAVLNDFERDEFGQLKNPSAESLEERGGDWQEFNGDHVSPKATTPNEFERDEFGKLKNPSAKLPGERADGWHSFGENTAQATHFVGLSPKENFILNHNPLFLKNTFHLPPAKLMEACNAHQHNLAQIFQGDQIERWQRWKDVSANKFLEKNPTQGDSLVNYINKLKEATGLKPKGGLLFRHETVNEYIARALQKAEQLGKTVRVNVDNLVEHSDPHTKIGATSTMKITPESLTGEIDITKLNMDTSQLSPEVSGKIHSDIEFLVEEYRAPNISDAVKEVRLNKIKLLLDNPRAFYEKHLNKLIKLVESPDQSSTEKEASQIVLNITLETLRELEAINK